MYVLANFFLIKSNEKVWFSFHFYSFPIVFAYQK